MAAGIGTITVTIDMTAAMKMALAYTCDGFFTSPAHTEAMLMPL